MTPTQLPTASIKLAWFPREQSGDRLFWARHVAPVFVQLPAPKEPERSPEQWNESTCFYVDSVALPAAHEREQQQACDGIPFEALDWSSAPGEPWGFRLEFNRDEKTGAIGATLVREYYVETPENPCKQGYDTEDQLARVVNPEVLTAGR